MFERLSQLAWAQFWQVSLLILVVGVLARFMSRRWPHFAWTLWVIVIVKCVTPPIWYSPSGLFCWSATKPILPHVEYTLPDDVFGKSDSNAPAAAFAQSASLSPNKNRISSEPVAASGQSWNVSQFAQQVGNKIYVFINSQVFANILIGVWLFGATLISTLLVYRWWAVFSDIRSTGYSASNSLIAEVDALRVQLGIGRKFNVIVTEANYGPCVFGFLKPTLILPQSVVEGTDAKTLRSILAHEIIHVRRGDTLLDFLQMFAQVLWWFHPMVWWANRQVNRLSEHCCDDETVVGLSCQPISYARGLLRVLELRNDIRPIVAVSGMRAAEVTRRRLESLMNRRASLLAKAPALCWLLALCGGLFFLPGSLENISPFGDNDKKTTTTVSTESLANSAFARKDWEAAAMHYQTVVENHPENGFAWFRLGYALHTDGRYQEAIAAHRQAANFPKGKHIAMYNWACALSCLEQYDEALEKLSEAIESGFYSYKILKDDADWDGLKDDPRFTAMLHKLAGQGIDPYRQFDFYIGNWEVRNTGGRRVGTSEITSDAKGYLISGKWQGTDKTSGTSVSFYDPGDEVWKQTWVDGNGKVTRLDGTFKDGEMVFEGTALDRDDNKEWVKVTIEPVVSGQIKKTVYKKDCEDEQWQKDQVVFYKQVD